MLSSDEMKKFRVSIMKEYVVYRDIEVEAEDYPKARAAAEEKALQINDVRLDELECTHSAALDVDEIDEDQA